MASWHWCCCTTQQAPFYSSGDGETEPCDDCGVDQPDCAASVVGGSCGCTGTDVPEYFQYSSLLCRWEWTGVDIPLGIGSVFVYYVTDHWEVKVDTMYGYWNDLTADLECGADGVISGTATPIDQDGACPNCTMTITFG